MEIILRLYDIYTDSLHRYNTLLWQLPVAVATFNAVILHYFIHKAWILFFTSLFNFIVIHSLYKRVFIQRAIIESIKVIESELSKDLKSGIIPNFQTDNKILKIKSASVLVLGLLSLNLILFLYALKQIV